MFEYRPLKNDCRVDMDDAQLGGYQLLVQEFKPDFQIPVLIALLSTQTNKFYTGSMVSAMERSFAGKSSSISVTMAKAIQEPWRLGDFGLRPQACAAICV